MKRLFIYFILFIVFISFAYAIDFKPRSNISGEDRYKIYNFTGIFVNDNMSVDGSTVLTNDNILGEDVNVSYSNQTTYWGSLSGYVSRWFNRVGELLYFNETLQNQSIDDRILTHNSTLNDTYVTELELEINNDTVVDYIDTEILNNNNTLNDTYATELETLIYILDNNGTVTEYIDSQDNIYNISMVDYVNTEILNNNNTIIAFINAENNGQNTTLIAYIDSENVAQNNTLIAYILQQILNNNNTLDDTYYKSGDSGVFNTINTGQGDNNLYAMNQNVLTTSSPTFDGITSSGGITMSGSASNIALGSNYLSGDGGDEGIYVDSTGNVGIGTTSPSQKLDVDGTVKSDALLIGNSDLLSSFRSVSGESSVSPSSQVLGTEVSTGIGIARFVKNQYSGNFYFAKSRGETVGSYTVVQNSDSLGQFVFEGSDGADFGAGAAFGAYVDGTPGNNDMPGRLVFATSPDGTHAPVDRMTIKSTGNVGIGTDSPSKTLDVNGQGNATDWLINGTSVLTTIGNKILDNNNTIKPYILDEILSNNGTVIAYVDSATGSDINKTYVDDRFTTNNVTLTTYILDRILNNNNTLDDTYISDFGTANDLDSSGNVIDTSGLSSTNITDFDIAGASVYHYANIINMSDSSITYEDLRDYVVQLGSDQEVTIAGENITSGTVADARIASTIARDSEVADTYTKNGTDLSALAITSTTLNTGQGDYELYAMNQDVESTDAVTFATVDTGQGANELYAMNQNVLTTSSPTFDGITSSGGITMSGSDSNIALGSNYLSGDGDDEGIYVDSSGDVDISGDLEVVGDIDAPFGSDTTRIVGIGLDGSFSSGDTGIFRMADENNQIESTWGGNLITRAFHSVELVGSTVGASGDKVLRVKENTTNRLVIDKGGKVGIGTDSPSKTLEVNGDMLLDNDWSGVSVKGLYNEGVTIYDRLSKYSGITFRADNASEDVTWRISKTGTQDIKFVYVPDDLIPLSMNKDGELRLTSLAGGGAQYVCTDNDGDLSAGASCTEFDILDDNYPVSMSDDEFKILDIQQETSLDEEYYGKLLNYHYKVAFGTKTNTKLGWIKVPVTVKGEYEVLHYLRQKITEYKGGDFSDKTTIDNDMVGRTYTISDFTDRAETYANLKDTDIIYEQITTNIYDDDNNIINTTTEDLTRKVIPDDIIKIKGKWELTQPNIIIDKIINESVKKEVGIV